MPRVTAMTPSRTDADRVTVKVDGKAAAVLSARDVVELRLKVGDDWDQALAERAGRAEAAGKARRDALRLLTRKGRSRRRLGEKLRDKGHEPEAVEAALDGLERAGLIDDLALGRALIRELGRAKPAGARLLRAKLFRAGLGDAIIAQVLAEHGQSGGDAALGKAIEMARRRYQATARLEEPARKRRLYGMLARRGFDTNAINRIMRAVTEGETGV